MGRFDSPAQIVGLFVAASVVSVGLIFLINAEQQSRLQAEHRDTVPSQRHLDMDETESGSEPTLRPKPSPSQKIPVRNNHMTLLNYFQDGVRKLFRGFPFRHTEPPIISRTERRKRSSKNSAYTYNNNNNLLVLDGENSEEPATNGLPRTQGTEFHKIRHAMKRLGGGGLDGDVVLRMILDSNPIPPDTPSTHHRPLEYQHHSLESPHHSRRRPESGEREHLPKSVHQKGYVTSSTEQFSERRERHYEAEPSSKTARFTSPMEKPSPAHFIHTPTPVAITEQGSGDPLERRALDFNAGANSNNASVPVRSHTHQNNRSSILVEDLEICYKTDDVLIVILITCCLNFAFVLLIWACVKWFSSSSSKEKDFHHLDCEEGDDSEDFPQNAEDIFWSTNGGNRNVKNRNSLGLTSASLYTFRPDYVPQQILRRSYSYSMEDLRYVQT